MADSSIITQVSAPAPASARVVDPGHSGDNSGSVQHPDGDPPPGKRSGFACFPCFRGSGSGSGSARGSGGGRLADGGGGARGDGGARCGCGCGGVAVTVAVATAVFHRCF
eukprot:TRINITY_DN2438_c5_g1_i1.p1 TRINITY_DN2438_c5_g1~~TRINITY_DN2438_c5_g1_i1.p1  ORF type:complete len:110 (+),score=1.35 TRINITY_DN2438_c5_g1_i1:258-587(+)